MKRVQNKKKPVKDFDDNKDEDPAFWKDYTREVTIMEKFPDHPNIIKMYDIVKPASDPTAICIVLELLDGDVASIYEEFVRK